MTQLTRNFNLYEFEAVSIRRLTEKEIEHARFHATQLQLVRDAINETFAAPAAGGEWSVHLTSFIRDTGGGDHATGAAVDWNVRDKNGTRFHDLAHWGRDWLAIRRPQLFAELLWENDHVHQARSGYSIDAEANDSTQILDKVGRDWVMAALNPIPKPARPIVLAIALGLGLYYGSRA